MFILDRIPCGVSTSPVCLESDCLVLLSAEGPTGGLVLSRDQAENDVNKQGLKMGPLTARRKMGYVVGQYKCGTPSLSSVTMFLFLECCLKGKGTILRCSHWKGREQNLMELGSNEEEFLFFQLFMFL